MTLDLFEVPPTQTRVAYGYWEQKGLTSALTDQGPYEFAVGGMGDEYIDLANDCTKSGSLRFSVFPLLTDFVCLYCENQQGGGGCNL